MDSVIKVGVMSEYIDKPLKIEQEVAIHAFAQWLGRVVGPDDLFPPETGVREPRPTPPSNFPSTEVELGFVALARVTREQFLACV